MNPVTAKLWSLAARFAGFGGVGALTTALSMLSVTLTNELLHWNAQVSYLFAYVWTLALSYGLNTCFVFKARAGWKKFAGYCAAYCSGMLVGMGLLKIASALVPSANPTLLTYGVIPLTMVWNFFFVNLLLTKRTQHG